MSARERRPTKLRGPSLGRVIVPLSCAVLAAAAAVVSFAFDALGIAVTAAGAVATSLALAWTQWCARRRALARAGTEVTIDLRHPLPRPSTADATTGLVDRAWFRTALTQRVASARRHLQPLSLVVFELDGFERVRPDQRDEALRTVARALRRTLRECDTACRYTDVAVAALLEDTPESGAATAAERVRRAVTATPGVRTFTLSAGIACYPSHALDAHDLLRRSVQALATARAAGKDRVEIAGGD